MFSFKNNETFFKYYTVAIGILHFILGIVVAVNEGPWFGCWLASLSVLMGIGCCLVLKKELREKSAYGYFLGLMTISNYGHCIACVLLMSKLLSNGHPMKTVLTSIMYFILGLISMHLHFWHKYGIWEDPEPDAIEFQEQNIWRPQVYTFVMTLLICFMLGIAETRLVSGHIPKPCPFEGVVGIINVGILLLHLIRTFRRSFKGCVVLLVWSIVSVLFVGFSSVCYAAFARTRALHMQYGISLLTSMLYSAVTFISITLKTCVLEEPILFRTKRIICSRDQEVKAQLNATNNFRKERNNSSFATVDQSASTYVVQEPQILV